MTYIVERGGLGEGWFNFPGLPGGGPPGTGGGDTSVATKGSVRVPRNWGGEPEAAEAAAVLQSNGAKTDDTGGLVGNDWIVLNALKVLKEKGDVDTALRENFVMSAFMALRVDNATGSKKMTDQHKQDVQQSGEFVANVINRARLALNLPLPQSVTDNGQGIITQTPPGGSYYTSEPAMSTTTMVAIGGAAVLGLLVFMMMRK